MNRLSVGEHVSLSPALKRALVDRCIQSDLVAFTRRAFEVVVPEEQLHLNWHIRAMAYKLEQVRTGQIRRLIINVPPRHLKSITASVAFPAFILGHDPTTKIICASYSYDLAAKLSRDTRAVMRSAWYRRNFPAARISSDKDTELEFTTFKKGGRMSTSVGGTLTGRGGSLVIIDDPMKPDEAMSETSRKRVVQWFEGTLLSRLDSKSTDAIIIVMQRLHVDDLAGILLEKGGWEHLNLPAIAEEPERVQVGPDEFRHRDIGDVLDPVRESKHVLDEIKSNVGSPIFAAQYQQQPVPLVGNLIKREWLSYYDTRPEREPSDLIVIS